MLKLITKLLLLTTLCLMGCTPRKLPVAKVDPVAQKATHLIIFMDGNRGKSLCTATAIGPHALMTASHCNKDEKLTTIHLDIVFTDFHIQKTLTDDRDHDIYLIDGPSLQNTVPYKVRAAKPGEHVHLYGNGDGEYPAHREDGVQTPFNDPSEIDHQEGVVQFSTEVIAGDSGSAVISDEDGSIVGVTSYLWTDKDTKVVTAVDFLPGFTDSQITEAITFAPSLDWKPPVSAKTPEPKRTPFVRF